MKAPERLGCKDYSPRKRIGTTASSREPWKLGKAFETIQYCLKGSLVALKRTCADHSDMLRRTCHQILSHPSRSFHPPIANILLLEMRYRWATIMPSRDPLCRGKIVLVRLAW